MSLFNFDAPLSEIDGSPILNPETGEPTTPLPLYKAIASILCGNYQDDNGIDGAEKFKRGVLAMRFLKGGDIELNVDETKEIKDIVGKRGITLLVVQVWNILDPK